MNAGKKTILVADDNPDILDMLELFLDECGYHVATVTSAAGLQAFPEGIPDLLLLDIWLAGTNGGDLCRQLKSQPETCSLPIILVSANRETETIARESGADGFVLKPFDLDALFLTLQQFLPDDEAAERWQRDLPPSRL